MKVTKLDLPSSGKIDHYFIAGDWHTQALNIPSFKILIEHAKLFPESQRKLIINGDFLDCPHLMKRSPDFKKWIARPNGIEEYFLPMSQDEFKWGNDTLDALQSVFKEIIFIEGNHDWRYDWFRHSSKCPFAYKEDFNYRAELNLTKRGITTVVGMNNWLDIGEVSITHGMYHGATCLKKHYEACGGRDVIFSHVHRYESKAFPVRGKTRHSRSLPAMCHLNPEYMRNNDNNWDNGYGQLYIFDDGSHTFNVNILQNNTIMLGDGTFFQG